MAFGRKGIGMVRSAPWISHYGSSRQVRQTTGVSLTRRQEKARIPVYASRLYSVGTGRTRAEAKALQEEGMGHETSLRVGTADGAAGMQRNLELVRTVREAVGEGIDVMADAYMGWSLDYAKRCCRCWTVSASMVGGAVIPDDIQGYAD